MMWGRRAWIGVRDLFSRWWIRLLIGIGLLTWLGSQVDWAQMPNSLRLLPAWLIVATPALFVILQWLYALRWKWLLDAGTIHISVWRALRLNYLSLFTSNFLPGSVGGDALKLAILGNQTQNHTIILATIVLDRVINTTATMLVLAMLLPRWEQFIEWRNSNAEMLFIGALTLGVIIGTVMLSQARWIRVRFEQLRQLVAPLAHPHALIPAYLIAISATFFSGVAGFLIAQSLEMDIAYLDLLMISLFLNLAIILPISFNGIGVTEAGFVWFATRFNVRIEVATAYALVARFLYVVSTLPGALELILPSTRSVSLDEHRTIE